MYKLTTNKASVTNVEKVCQIFDAFDYLGFTWKIRTWEGRNILELKGDDSWPLAVKFDEMPIEEQFDNEDAYFHAQLDVLYEKGDKGFLSLLNELAPYLQTPLVILLSYRDGRTMSQTWSVQPGGKEVIELFLGFDLARI